jgi:hypothetical protein
MCTSLFRLRRSVVDTEEPIFTLSNDGRKMQNMKDWCEKDPRNDWSNHDVFA